MAVNALPLLLLAGAAFLLMRGDEDEDEVKAGGNGDGGRPLPDVTDEDGNGIPDVEEPEPEVEAKPEIVIYSAPWCPACQKTKDHLEKHDFDYTVRDIDADPTAVTELEAIGVEEGFPTVGIPVLVITYPGRDSIVIMGFDKKVINAELGIPDRIITISELDDPHIEEINSGAVPDAVLLVGSNPENELDSLMMLAIEEVAETSDLPFYNLPRGSAAAMKHMGGTGPLGSADDDMFLFGMIRDAKKTAGGESSIGWANMVIVSGADLSPELFDAFENNMSTAALTQASGFPYYYSHYPIELPAETAPDRNQRLQSLFEAGVEIFTSAVEAPFDAGGTVPHPAPGPSGGQTGQIAALGSFQDAVDTALA